MNRLTQTCSATGAPSSSQACSAGTRLSSFNYSPLGLAGNRTTVAELSGRNVAYGYDADYLLTSEAIASDPAGNNGSETYTFDVAGNRKTLNSTIPALPGNPTYSYDANDRLTTDSYDANGTRLLRGQPPMLSTSGIVC